MAQDSDDDLGGYDPTTPAPPKKAPARSQPAGRAAAGPSAKLTATQTAKASSSKGAKNSTPDEAIILYSDDDAAPPPPKNKGKAPASSAPPATNGKVTNASKAKGKAKADIVQNEVADAMEVDDVQMVEKHQQKADPRPKARPAAKPPNKPQTRPPRENTANDALERENARLRKQLEEVMAHRDKLAQQVQESLQIRQTEPEQKLQECIEQYEATIRAQEQLLQEQTTQLSRYGAVSGSKSNPALQFLSREAVNEEKKSLEAKVKQLENIVKQKDAEIVEQDKKYHELEKQLDFEVKMHKEYQAKNAPGPKLNGGPRAGHTSPSPDPLQGEVTKLYEDCTNLLITKVTSAPSPYPAWPELKEYTFNCTFTYVDPGKHGEVAGGNPTLQFNIRALYMRKTATDPDDRTPPTSRDELEAKCQYWPLNLERESREFRQRLDFFKESFIFSRDQMSVFVKTLGERLAATLEGDDDDEVEEVG
ncbi:hypothetical protein PsYK624_126410 [Phanerochaete sordida]|uniref:Monopolin complex subunit Csm1/Pcs1 C-terminal domain-containing protein n=1 Tax=Phanerochaete sordida TaxID=48140 RepID=A0A9P3LJ92_9APHY|nr:hypothetical protein PsYK624_126410 [Phanerochaete sordida]